MPDIGNIPGPLALSDQDLYKVAARNLLGDQNMQWSWLGVPEICGQWLQHTAGTGSVSAFDGYAPVIQTGANASSENDIYTGQNSATISSGLISVGGSAAEWYMAARVKVRTAIDAQAVCIFGMRDLVGTKFCRIGVVGSVTAASFVIQGDTGAGFAIGAFDNAWHVFEAYRRGGTTYARMDGGAWASGNTFPGASGAGNAHFLNARVANGTTAANRDLAVNWVCAGYGRA